MKIILSRKGFDSTNGGMPSPIMPDGTMLSMPIPSDDGNTYDDLCYDGKSYTQILHELRPKKVFDYCHIDPDLDKNRHSADIVGWKPGFGQINASQGYLENCNVGPGDIFLFFGNFHFVENVNGKYRFMTRNDDPNKCRDIQVIWGYLQIREVVKSGKEIKSFFWHPHSSLTNSLNGRLLQKTMTEFLLSVNRLLIAKNTIFHIKE